MFYHVVYTDLIIMCKKEPGRSSHPNLTTGERFALNTLSKSTNIVIKLADKGDAIVVQDRDDYVREAMCLLSDNTYRKLLKDPLPEFTIEANQLIDTALSQGVITKTEAAFFWKGFFKVPLFLLPA